MTSIVLENTRIVSHTQLPSPAELHSALPLNAEQADTVAASRKAIEDILDGRDSRKLLITGPCSIHDPVAALDYARRLVALSKEVEDQFLVIMRVYFEKPRTTVGWKGLINDPNLDETFDVEKGLHIARKLMRDIVDLGLPIGTEALDPLTPQYLGDLISWSAIGARTTESQTHREMSSGLSTPVGFKNGTDGSLEVAINAMLSAQSPHAFLGVNAQGMASVVRTTGNAYGHLILRGGATPNYDSVSVSESIDALHKAGLEPRIIVDCSHANSHKNFEKQVLVMRDIVTQIKQGTSALMGVMLESNIVAGNQKLSQDLSSLVYGKSVTDGCMGWDDTADLIRSSAQRLRD